MLKWGNRQFSWKYFFLGVEIDVIPQTNPRSSFELIISDETMFFFSTDFGRGGIIHNRIKRCMLWKYIYPEKKPFSFMNCGHVRHMENPALRPENFLFIGPQVSKFFVSLSCIDVQAPSNIYEVSPLVSQIMRISVLRI